MPFVIVRNDIANMCADAIVNTANPHPVVGGGTDTAVYEAAGFDANVRGETLSIPEFARIANEIVKRRG